ncbi:MAG: hypothetical protein Q8P72_04125 [Candidatus Roizmanbacteria bacterium]|nr:hypothetical protein [Candidatus Roizmanbacteria bacterium]
MYYTATVTSQGQITIPAKLRRELDLDRATLSITKNSKGNIEIEKVPDLMNLYGALYDKRIRNKSYEQIAKIEKEAIEKAVVDRYHRKK